MQVDLVRKKSLVNNQVRNQEHFVWGGEEAGDEDGVAKKIFGGPIAMYLGLLLFFCTVNRCPKKIL